MAAENADLDLPTENCVGEPSGSAQGQDNARTPQRLRTSRSPTETCAICMEPPKNKAFPDCCVHAFCFSCLFRWARVQDTCPLCKQEFRSIIYGFCSSDAYEEDFDGVGGDSSESFTAPEEPLQENVMRSQQERARREAQPHGALRNPSPYNPREAMTTRDRFEMYESDLWAVPRSNYRETSAEFYCSHPSHTLRLVPWVTRELTALMQGNLERVTATVNNVLELIRNFGIRHREFSRRMEPFLHGYREHFVHEFYSFASSVFETMDDYDRNTVYASRNVAESQANQFQRRVEASRESEQAPSRAARAAPVADTYDSPQLEPDGLHASSMVTAAPSSTVSDSDSDSSDCVIVAIQYPSRESTPEVIELSSDEDDTVFESRHSGTSFDTVAGPSK